MKIKLFIVCSIFLSCNAKHQNLESSVFVPDLNSSTNEFVQSEDIKYFLTNISRDSTFQLSRIVFPLTYEYLDFDNHDILSKSLRHSDWEHVTYFEFEQPNAYMILICLNDECSYRGLESFVIHFSGIENGINIRYHFELIDGKWFLVKVRDLST